MHAWERVAYLKLKSLIPTGIVQTLPWVSYSKTADDNSYIDSAWYNDIIPDHKTLPKSELPRYVAFNTPPSDSRRSSHLPRGPPPPSSPFLLLPPAATSPAPPSPLSPSLLTPTSLGSSRSSTISESRSSVGKSSPSKKPLLSSLDASMQSSMLPDWELLLWGESWTRSACLSEDRPFWLELLG